MFLLFKASLIAAQVHPESSDPVNLAGSLEELIANGKFESEVSLFAKEDNCSYLRVEILYTDSDGTTYLYAVGNWQSEYCITPEDYLPR